MKILGVIAEYNPFHYGHQYHLQTAKKLSNADGVICILSSSFMQRGEPGIVDKWSRCQMALEAGIDLVLELPTAFSCRSAYWFALGGVQSLAATGIITHLAFGAETDNLAKLKKLALMLNREDSLFKNYLNKFLNSGYSYPKARSLTLEKIIDKEDADIINELDNPNNILALAYLRILDKIKSPIDPILIKRKGSYHATIPENGLASATAIRTMIKNNDNQWKKYLPETTVKVLENDFARGKGPIYLDSFEESILSIIRRMEDEDILNIIEIEEGLESRIWQLAQSTGSIFSLINKIKTKRYTYTRIQRSLIHLLLGFTKDLSFTSPYYLRVLGFSSQGKDLLKEMKTHATVPIITKFADGFKVLNSPGIKMLNLEARASDLYTLSFPNNQLRFGRQDFYQSPIIKDWTN